MVGGLVSLFNGISTFLGYLMPKLFSKKNSSGTIQPIYSWEDKGVHTFPKSICPKLNVRARLQSIALTITPRGHPQMSYV